MSLIDRLAEDIKTAMKARDQLRLDVIRMAKAALMNREIELKGTLDDAESTRVMVGLVKQRKESVEQFQKGQRPDLADKEIKEIAIIETYLPKALSQDEVRTLVEAVIAETGLAVSGPNCMGNVCAKTCFVT
ncbi:MAG: GatB/YqeY domain-containing protein, partial [Nitrospira sp.]